MMFPYNQMMGQQGMISPTQGLFNQPTSLTGAFQPQGFGDQGGFGAFLQQLFGSLPGGTQSPLGAANPVQAGFGSFMQRPTLESLGATGLGSSFYQQPPQPPQAPRADWSFVEEAAKPPANPAAGNAYRDAQIAKTIRAMNRGNRPDDYMWQIDRLSR